MSQATGAASGYPPDMIRPERIANIPMLSADRKTYFTEGLTKLWAALESNPRGSENYNKAHTKIKEVSKELMRQISNWKTSNQQQQQQQGAAAVGTNQAARPQPQSQPSQTQQGQQQTPAQQQQQQQPPPQNQPAPSQQPAQQPPSQTPQPQQQHAQPPQMQQRPPQQAQQPQSQPQGQAQPPSFPIGQQAKTFINGFKVFPATNIDPNSEAYEAYKRSIMQALTSLVTMQESSISRFQQFHDKIQALQAAGQPVPPQMLEARDSARSGVQAAKVKMDAIGKTNEKNRLAWAEKQAKQAAAAAAADGNNPQPPVGQNAPPFNPQTAAVNNQTQQQQQQPMSPAVPNNYQQPTTNLPMQQPASNQPIPRTQSYQSPAQGGPPQPLSHQAAVSQANRTYTDAQQQGQNTPTPGSAGNNAFSTHVPKTTLNVNNPNFHIPKTLPPQSHTPVPLGPARPTFGGPSNGAPGMLGQPAVQKTPHFILEGEGDRVLSKKKLDELVRQVTGGGEGDGLTPDVEEAVLSLADDFVDNVITAACRLAKIRPNSTLDIRDIQIILERNYNIRVPGYSLDEIRTVRKFQPAAGWTQKMNAVQAAKVMGKNDS